MKEVPTDVYFNKEVMRLVVINSSHGSHLIVSFQGNDSKILKGDIAQKLIHSILPEREVWSTKYKSHKSDNNLNRTRKRQKWRRYKMSGKWCIQRWQKRQKNRGPEDGTAKGDKNKHRAWCKDLMGITEAINVLEKDLKELVKLQLLPTVALHSLIQMNRTVH